MKRSGDGSLKVGIMLSGCGVTPDKAYIEGVPTLRQAHSLEGPRPVLNKQEANAYMIYGQGTRGRGLAPPDILELRTKSGATWKSMSGGQNYWSPRMLKPGRGYQQICSMQ